MVQSPDAVPYIGGGIYRESANRHLPRRANQVRRPTSVFHLSSPFRKNISVLQKPNQSYIPAVPSHKGAARDRHETRDGMRWTRTVLLTRAPDADGEGVWS